jgi:hypothetical protein
MGASENLVADYVAGAFYGLTIGPSGVAWQPNLLYVFYQNDGPSIDEAPMQIVSTRIIDGVFVIGSSLSNDVKCLVDPAHDIDPVSWMDRNRDRLGTAVAMQESRLVAFVRTTGASIAIVENDKTHFGWTSENGVHLAMSPELRDRLRWKPSGPGDRYLSLGIVAPVEPPSAD